MPLPACSGVCNISLNGFDEDWYKAVERRKRTGGKAEWRVKEKVPLETEEQAKLISWSNKIAVYYPAIELLHSIPNGASLMGRTTAKGKRVSFEALKLKREGLKNGVPDLMLPVPRDPYHGLYIEMKRLKGSTTSPEQIDRIDRLRQQGYRVEICKGAAAAKLVIVEYLGLNGDLALVE